MKQIGIAVVVLLFLGTALAAQPPEENPDWIRVLAVSTDRPVEAGVEVEFTFDIEYDLVSAERGIIGVGFDLDSPVSFRMVGELQVEAGTGVVTMKVKAVPVDWKDRGGFFALLILSEYPHNVQWRPLADAQYPIDLEE